MNESNLYGNNNYLILGIASALSGFGLLLYGNRFLKKTKNAKSIFTAFFAILILLADTAQACPICSRNITGPQADAINAGILTLLFCIVAVLICFAVFFIYLAKKSKNTSLCHKE